MNDNLTARCPVCGKEFEYPKSSYKPQTCDAFGCAWAYNHNPERYDNLIKQIDKLRGRASI